ncbi:LysM peptidoglycan-binding domain-containing protein [Vibrio sp. Isolate25]|uniref:LysM peptidoglycan-binding domain-containing protein n=1 Tax=Vibrio sp. Isolate25 TaxID=2908535 RepID=UPI001EFEB245|nr:LysM peptidoglycan-binding domain-containing protein [Vibrio sp. Isolate25]MCG9595278.1 LysM peptidoglycan-binding domain-containing protein [Vibrio sp. Isolate25]
MAALDFKPRTRVTHAGYKPIEGAFQRPKTSSSFYHSVPDTPEPTPEYQCRIKIHCEKEDLNALTVGVWTLGRTQADKPVRQWSAMSSDDGNTLLTALCFEKEEKTLYHDAFQQAGHSTSYKVTSTTCTSEYVNAEFIPVKLAIQPNETRLAWATEGYFYHFVENRLIKEYKVVGNGRWTLQLTRSTHELLTDELVSEHHYPAILLPYKIERREVSPQHLLYRSEKLSAETLASLDHAWLNQHAMTLDLPSIVAERGKPLIKREPASKVKQDDTVPSQTHIVQRVPETGKRELWPDIAAQYGLSSKALLQLNPKYDADPTQLRVGDKLTVSESVCKAFMKPPEMAAPIESLKEVHLLGNVWGRYHELALSESAVNIMEDRTVSGYVPVLNSGRIYRDTTNKQK